MPRDSQETNQQSDEKPKKSVRYRARHKALGHLKKEDTTHGFMERIRVAESESRASEPPLVGVFVVDDATDLQTIPLTRNNYRKASGKLEDKIKAQPLRRTRTLPSSSNTARAPGMGPYSMPPRSRTDAREIPNYNLGPNQPAPYQFNFDAVQRVPYNTPSMGVPMPLPNQFVDDAEMAHLLDSAVQPIFEANYFAGAEQPMSEMSSLTSWGGRNIAPVYEPSPSIVPEGLPNPFIGGATDWYTSHGVDFALSEPSVAYYSGMGYNQNFTPSDDLVDFQMFDPNAHFLTSPASYQSPLFECAPHTVIPFSEFSPDPQLQGPMYNNGAGSMPQQDFDPRMQSTYYWPSN